MTGSRCLAVGGLIWLSVLPAPFRASLAATDDPSVQWTQSTPLPEPTSDYAAGVLDGKLVIAGGTYWNGSKGHWVRKRFSATTHAFAPTTQAWERLPDLPIPLACAASAVIENRLFVAGGFDGARVNHKIYSLGKESGMYAWTSFATLPVDRLFAGAVSVGKQLYLLGGTTQFEPTDAAGTCCTSKTATSSFMVLDTSRRDKGWTQLAPLPGPPRWFFSTATDGKSIWIFGGRSQLKPHDPITSFRQVFRYDIGRGRWQEVESLPELSPDAVPPSPVLVNGKIILVSDYRKVWLFDPVSGAYRDLTNLPQAVAVDRFVWLNGLILGAGGENQIEGPRRRSDWTFVGRFVSK